MVDYHKFSNQMRPLSESILNSLKVKERLLNEKIVKEDRDNKSLQNFIEMQDMWFQLVQLLISAA